MAGNKNSSAPAKKDFFDLAGHGTNVKTEIIAGITTFLAMAYILAVNPSMLAATGMDQNAVFVATALSAALATFIMGFLANYPVALASGMGLNAYFTYSVCLGMGLGSGEIVAQSQDLGCPEVRLRGERAEGQHRIGSDAGGAAFEGQVDLGGVAGVMPPAGSGALIDPFQIIHTVYPPKC